MKIIFYTKNVKLTPELEKYAREKITKLEKYLPSDKVREAKIELTSYDAQRKGNKFVAEAEIILPFGSLRASEASTDIHASLDLIIPKLRSEIEKYKGKWQQRRREGRR